MSNQESPAKSTEREKYEKLYQCLAKLRGDKSLWETRKAIGGQDQYAGSPRGMRYIDGAIEIVEALQLTDTAGNSDRKEAWQTFLVERLEIKPGEEKYIASGFSLRDMWTAFAAGRRSMATERLTDTAGNETTTEPKTDENSKQEESVALKFEVEIDEDLTSTQLFDTIDELEKENVQLKAENDHLTIELINFGVEHPCYKLSKELEAENNELKAEIEKIKREYVAWIKDQLTKEELKAEIDALKEKYGVK